MGEEIKDRAALDATLRFMDERIKPRRCDSDGISGCWRCQSMYLAKRMRELLDERAASPVAADTMGDAWQPIATAPKDGTNILGWYEKRKLDDEDNMTGEVVGGGMFITSFSGGYWSEHPELNSAGSNYFDDWRWADEPSLWKPLPAGPAAITEGKPDA